MRVKDESEKVGLKLNIQKTKIMASGLITSWQIDGETMEAVRDFIFLGSIITADGDCSHEIKRRLLLGRKIMTNLDSLLKSRDFLLCQQMSILKKKHRKLWFLQQSCTDVKIRTWTIKKAEHQRTDAFNLWCQRRLFRAPSTTRRSNLSILKEINP